ncbi:cell death abnormality protein 1-like [Ruditapes philippinarum]|uniref:cell death abnormality protein 1-like n=1 Tax=Ruditapes philippinarum TaxID=129788 RepID=UPI00295A9A01|nr:cell death abnormality protein 1-like [Ruditapes philippinarum]
MSAFAELFQQLREISKTSQTGLFSNNPDYGSSKAIDGLNNYNIDACKCCSVTADANPPISWWHIDLKRKYIAYGLEIFGREKINEGNNNQIQNAKIYASNSSMEDSIDTGYLLFDVPTIDVTTHFIKHLQRPVIGQYFIVRINNTLLALCEIIVYGKGNCNVGSFGLSCTSKCHCEDKMSCHPWTGYCQTPGCMPGWKVPSCDKECTAGKFGRDCSRTCSNNCLHGVDQCSKISGKCQSGCVAGFKGHNCSTPCETGRFGVNCTSYCSIHCFKGIEQCNKSSGICKAGCEAGYMGNNCSTVCPDGQYGRDCTGNCSESKNGKAACNKATGYCMDGCNPGFTGPKCSRVSC